MNEEAVKYAFDLFVKDGYGDNIDDFRNLMKSDPKAIDYVFNLFVKNGYGDNINDFKNLLGITQSQSITPKKKGESMVSDSEVSSSELPWGDVFRINKDTGEPSTESTPSDGRPSGYKFNFWGNEVSPESIEEQAKQREDAQKRAATLQRKPYTAEEMEAGKQKLKTFEQGYTPKEPGIGGIDFAMPEVKSESTRVEKPIDIKTEKEKEKQRIILEEQQKKRQEAKDLENWRQSNIKSDEAVKLEKEKKDSAFNRSLTDIELSSSLLSVNQDLIDKNQNTAIEELTNQFGKYGFNFKPGGEWLGHSLIVSTDDGKNSIQIDLKPGSDELKESESLKLRNFISNYNIVPETKKSFVDQEGENFYKERNRDYYTEKRRWERYNELNDIVGFFEGYIKKGKEKVEQQYPDLFYKGDPVWNIGEKIQEYKQELETLRPLLKDDTFFSQTNTAERTREDFDAFLAKKENEIIKSAAEVNKQAKVQEDAISEESRRLFNMDIQDLIFYKSDNPEYQKDIDNLINQFIDAQDTRKGAAARYEFAKLYYNEKVNKDINGDLTDNFVALWNTVGDNYKQGLVNDQLLALAMPGMYIPYSGTTDLKEASEYIISKINSQSGTQSRVETRLQNAKTRQDYIDVMLDNPLESMVIAAAGSLSLMLPTGFKIIPAFTAGGAVTGSVVPGVGTVLGAGRGFEVGQAVNSYALEYTSAIMEAVENSGYNPMDPESLAAGLADERVWKNATDQSLARGIPIALADYMSSKLTGRVFKPSSKLDGLGKRIALGAAERVIVDPALESAGEALAQSSEIFFGTGRGELDIKEIIAEGRGALGSKLPNMIGQLYYNAKTETNAGLASNLTKIHNVGVATESDEKISNWANNMQQLGKIDSDVNQRIQENVGLRRDAKELLNIGNTEKKSEGPVVSRVMELLSAKKELSATKNRQEVYSEKIKEINNELAMISQTKKLLPDDKKTNLDGIIEARREDVSEYKINGVVYNKDKFLSKLNSMSSNRLMNATIGIKGDEETSKLLKDKVDAIQKQTAGEVPVQPEAGVGEEVVQGKPEAGLEVTSEQVVTEEKPKEEVVTPEAEAKVEEVVKEEAPAEVTPAPKTTTDIITSAPIEIKGGVVVTDSNGNDVMVNGNEQVAAKLYDEAMAIPEEQRTLNQNDIVEKVQRIISQVAAEVTPEAEVTPVEKTPEQEADLLEELLTGKKKKPAMTPQVETMTPGEEVMTPEAKAEEEMIVQPEFTEQDQARKRELEDALKKADKRKKNVMVGEVSMPKVEAKAELDTLRQKEQAVVEAEVQSIEKMLSAPEQKDKGKIRQAVTNAAKAIAKILPNTKIVLHETSQDYVNATGDTDNASGLYVPSADGGTIHVNLSNANTRTVGHEVFHATLLRGIKTDAEAQRLAKAMIGAVAKSLKQSGANQELLNELENFLSNYDENIQNEEYLAEVFGYLADGYPQLTAPEKSIINRFIERIMKLFGLKPMTDTEVIDFMNTLSRKVATGEEITDSDISKLEKAKTGTFKGGKKVENPSKGLTGRKRYGDEKVNLQVRYIEQERMNELIEKKLVKEVDDLSELNGYKVVTTSPDDMLVGSIYVNGKEVAIGNGGIFFVTKFGDVWANSNEGVTNGLAAAINESYVKNNGKAYLLLVKGTDAKLVSSPQGVTSSLAVVEAMLDAKLFSLSDFEFAIKEAVEKNGGNISLSKNANAIELKKELDSFFSDVTSSTFEKRGNVLKSIISILAKSESAKQNSNRIIKFLNGDISKGIGVGSTPKSQSLVDLIAKVSAEELTKGLSTGDIYGAIEINSKVKVFKDEHQSYPYHIKMIDENGKISSKKPILILPRNRKNGKDILTSLNGETYKDLGTGFAGKVGATANLPFGKGIVQDTELSIRQQKVNKEVQGIEQLPAARKQIIGENAKLAQDVRDNLQVARNMETAGKDAKTIRITTGWEKGKDNKWRYEILDGDLKEKIGNVKGNLSDVLENKDLFNAYPELAKLEVDLRLNGLDEGIYEVGKQKIKVNGSKGTMLSILLHEVQHAIQSIEGFAKGGNIEIMKTPNDILVNLINQLPSKTLTREEKSLIKDEYEKNGLKRLPILPTSSDITSGDIDVIEDFIDKLDILIELFPNETSYKNLRDFLDLKLLDISGIEKDVETAFEKYQKLAGEVEARNVQTRMDMTPEQRSMTTLQETEDVAREDQVIFFDTNLSPRQQKSKNNQEIIKQARANGISEAGIRAYFKKNGLSDIEIDELLEGEKGAGKKIELSEETLPGYTKLMNRINGVISRGRKSGKSDDVIMQGVIANVEANSPEYANATDQQREQIIRDIRKMFGKKEKAAPSAEKITGKPKPKKVTVNEMAALKDQIRLEARAAREAKGDLNNKRKMLAEAINKLVAKGTLTVRQANAIIKRVNLVNLDNPIMVERLLNYAEKVFKDAEYADKLSEANKLFSSIKQSSKSKEKNADLVTLAKEFLGIDPSMVENIDEYIQKASELDSSLKGSKSTAKGMSASEMINIQEATEYISETMKAQEQKIKEQTAAEIESTMGLDASDLTYEQMLELLEDENKPINKDKEKVIRSLVNKMFDTYSSIIEYMFKTGKNPFVVYDENLKYEPVTFKESDKQIVREFMKMDLGKLSVREALKAMDALNNFIVNRSVANMGSVVAQYKAKQNAEIVDKKNIRSKPVKYLWSNTLGKMLFDNFASFPLLIERFFKSKDIGLYVSKMMGLNDLFNGASSAKTITGVVVKNYLDLFSKTKPNGKVFNDAFNLVERGMVAFMSRHKVGTDAQIKEEFNDRKNEIEESIKALSTGTKREQEKAKVYKEVYDKLFKDAKNADDIRNNADNKNIEAVDWWVNEWKNHYDELADVSLKIYNTKLDKDSYYTTDRYSKLEGVEKEIDLDDNVSAFSFNNGNISEKKAGSLMETRDKKSGLPKNKDGEVTRFVDLSFDAVNANSLYDALTDIKTAYAIKQVKAFMKTDAFKKIVPDKEERDILENRINLAVRNVRNQKLFDSSTMSKVVKGLNKISSIGSTMALAGIVQPFKQTIPIAFNTFINTGKFFDLLPVLTNSDVKDFINNSGYAIANRGIESSVHLESINKKLDEAAKTKAEYLGNKILELNEMYMKLFLANPDAWIAKASWMAYYEKGLRKQGLYKTTETIKTASGTREVTKKGIDYSKHKINKEAADYAQMMIDRQQNITDTRLAGSIYSGENAFQTMMTKIFLPLASFRINQHLRMSNDLANTFSKTTSWQEKRESLTSLSGAIVEMIVFRAIGIGASYLFFELASMIRGEEDDEEKKKRKEKMVSNTLKGILTGAVTDILSPVPVTDYPVKYSVNAAMDFTQDLIGMTDEDKLSLYVENIPSFSNVLGTAGIFLDKVADIKETAQMAATGKFEQEVFGKKIEKEISEKDRQILAWSLIPSILTNTILPGAPETNNIMSKLKKGIKKDGKTADQKEKYDAFDGHSSEKEFRTENPEKYMESLQPGGSLYEYKMRENQKKMEELPEKLQKKMEETMEKANKMQ